MVVGILLLFFTIYLSFAFLSYLFTGAADQSFIENRSIKEVTELQKELLNWTGAFGAYLSDLLLNRGFGIATLFPLLFLFHFALNLISAKPFPFMRQLLWSLGGMIWGSIVSTVLFVPIFSESFFLYGGAHGILVYRYLLTFLGHPGTILLVVALSTLLLILYDVRFVNHIRSLFGWRITLPTLPTLSRDPKEEPEKQVEQEESPVADEIPSFQQPVEQPVIINTHTLPAVQFIDTTEVAVESEPTTPPITTYSQQEEEEEGIPPIAVNRSFSAAAKPKKEEAGINIQINVAESEDEGYDPSKLSNYDPTLDLSKYQYPSADLLKKYDDGESAFVQEEQNNNINRIRETLQHYGITISDIKATVGPTITLYEIIPAPGVRVAKIKSLEDDIALSLAALGIRIIAPIPGKGTVGIEVPNNNPKMVSMQSCIASKKFFESKFDLPVALGKTITNEVFMFDLAKMPHLLVAGATGQGKSVGLNAIITSLLYKKHPSQLKFVLVDPKKVEFSIYSMIEKHFLAKLPDEEDPIITDVTKVIQTLNSITREMDTRYDLLKLAHTRNIKEYNDKFINRKLNPESGHRYMPYIVVVIDEFGDLIMTAGKEVELPIARIAQLARAVGIHMILATQRPSTNIITGTIKANFPGRVAFRVASGIDSRTILDATGANQLVGRGDLLFSQGNDLIRVQCAFVDTPEVEEVVHHIGKQQGYASAFMLPEVEGEMGENGDIIDSSDRDPLFEEAARFIVAAQQGSTSSLQRRMSLGYNRAGRLIDQLEKAGIVGPADGSKPRKVLVMDEHHLEIILNK